MPKKWRVAEPVPALDATAYPDINPVIFRLLASRGIAPELMSAFLAPDYVEQLHDPFLFKDMRGVAELIMKHIRAGNGITVYGDYDADGVTSTAVVVKTLQFIAGETGSTSVIDAYIPDRIAEGYGMNLRAMETLATNGTKLVITVDTGIRNAAAVAHAQALGLEVIVTDHHEAPEDGTVPPCLLINPKVPGETYPFLGLAGCGVAFKTCQALLQTAAGSEAETQKKYGNFEKWLLDLVAIGTIADLMPLVDENRVLVAYGLVVLNKTKRLGLRKLIDVAQSNVDRNGNGRIIDTWQVGFQIAPRLNAAGRLGHANNAYKLLVTEDEFEAMTIAKQLNETNIERQAITQEIFDYVERQAVTGQEKILSAVWPGIRADEGSDPWPAGVMGLVAGKLTEAHYRPAVAITVKRTVTAAGEQAEEIVGSGRSIPEFDITALLEECKEHLTHYGGHKQACGFTVRAGHLDAFLAQAQTIAERGLKDTELVPTLEVDMAIDLNDITEELYLALEALKPCGVHNPQPKFASYDLPVVDLRTMGGDGQHVKIKVQAPNKITYDCVAFNVRDAWKGIAVGDRLDIVYYIDINEWNGRRELQLKIVDLKKSE